MIIDGVDAYKQFQSIQYLPYDEFCIQCDLKFSFDDAVEPNFGSLVVKELCEVSAKDAEDALMSSVLNCDEYQRRFTEVVRRVNSKLAKIEHCAKNTSLFDNYLSESYFYGQYGDEHRFTEKHHVQTADHHNPAYH